MHGSSDCPVCNFHSQFDLYHVIYAIKGYCMHSKYFKSSKPEFRILKAGVILDLILVLVLLFPLATYVVYMPVICETDKFLCLMFIADEISIFGGVGVVFMVVLQIETELQEHNQWLAVFEICKKWSKFKTLLRKLHRRRKLTLSLIFFGAIIVFVLHFVGAYDTLPWSMLRKLSLVSCIIVEMYGTFAINQRCKLTGITLEALKDSLKATLRSRLHHRRVQLRNLESIFQTYHQLLGIVSANARLLSVFMTTASILWNLTTILTLIFNIFIPIRYQNYDLRILVVLQARTFITLFQLVTMYVNAEVNMRMKSEDILSFLFKYPISKLTAAEAAQVEVLITTLTIQKPVLRASDIFTVGTRLLASISGTVVTYVLVALQFHASWAN